MSSLLAVRQFWLASVENERLQQEISARMKAETELLQTQPTAALRVESDGRGRVPD